MSQGPRSGLYAVSSALLAMSSQLEVRDVLKTIVASARELLDAEYAALGVPDDHGGFAQFVVDGVSDEQWKALQAAFPTGVCDWTKPGVGYQDNVGWLTFADGPGGTPLGDPPRSRPLGPNREY